LNSLRGRDIISLNDFSRDEMYTFIEVARDFKVRSRTSKMENLLNGKTIAMVFESESTRTRTGFEAAMALLGGHAVYLHVAATMASRGEPWKDTAAALSRIVDGIVVRFSDHETACEVARHAKVPVMNGATPRGHPVQALGELFTIKEKKGELEGLKLAYSGMTRAMCHSLLVSCPKLGIDLAVAYPDIYKVDQKILNLAQENSKETGSEILLTHDLLEAVDDADIIYSCNLTMGEYYKEGKKRQKVNIKAYRITSNALEHAKKDVIFMHPGPVLHNLDVTDEVLEGSHSVFLDQVENAVHMKKAVLALLLA
jgi:ornithine carbamoyltransferase